MSHVDTVNLKQPKVFPLSVMTALFERSGFYALTFVLVLYIKSVYNISDKEAFVLFGVFNALVFLTPAIGGYLADNVLGIRRTMFLGLGLETLGLVCLSLPNDSLLYFSLACVVMGVGFFKVGPTNLMGRSYTKNDPRIDGGFTLYYMMMNVGAFFSPIVMGYLQRYYGWHTAFLYGAVVLGASLIAMFLLRHRADDIDVEASKKKISVKQILVIAGSLIGACAFIMFLLDYTIMANISFAVITVGLLIYFANEIRVSPKPEKRAILACLSLIFIGIVFFVLYFQIFMSVTLFIKRSVSHQVFGHDIPASAFLALNNFWIIAFSPLLVMLYNRLAKRNKDIPINTKFALGIFVTSLCFLTLCVSTYYHDSNWQVSSVWVVLAVMLYSLGELLVSALGVAMVTKIAPKRMYGVMMGAWFLIANSLASAISSSVASLADVPDTLTDGQVILSIYNTAFLKIGLVGVAFAIAVYFIGPYIKKMSSSS